MKLNFNVFTDFCESQLLYASQKDSGKHFLARCPICGDSQKSKYKKRLNVNWNNGHPVYHCFNCGDSGTFVKLYSNVNNITQEEAKSRLFEYNPDFIKETLSPKKVNKQKNAVYKPIDFYKELKSEIIKENECDGSIACKRAQKHLKNFRENRKISSSIPLYYAYKGAYKNRIIIPVFHNEKMIYFQARRVHPNQQPKYMNPGVKKDNIILNIENMNPDDPVIITEGLLDAYTIGKQATTVLGATLHSNFIDVIVKNVNNKIILVLDNYLIDERGKKELLKIIEKAPFRDQLYYFDWTCLGRDYKDLNDFYILNNINKLEVYKKVVENSVSRVTMATKIKLLR